MVESTANDDWENIRGPRPWEDNSEYLRAKEKQQKERQKQQEERRKVFVVNTSLKMGAGKMAAQVGHAAVGLFRHCQMSGEQGQMSLNQWR
uniref:peptidyl-tRNA hydrolase n=1 Tax=Meloidogyne javanica TaxID=6303 RepID=A0A915LLR8_MELJA